MHTESGWKDVVEIEQLLYRIAGTADTARDIQDYLDLLTPDVVFDFAEVPAVGLAAHRYKGIDEVRAGALDRRAAGVQGPGSHTLHLVSDVVVRFSSPATADVGASWQYLGIRDGVPGILAMGLYENTIRKVSDRWLLSGRKVLVLG